MGEGGLNARHVDFYRGRRVMITGGCGFIGSNLAIRLVELGADVLIVDSMIPEYGGNLFNLEPIKDAARINFSDVRDTTTMACLVQGQEVIFNLAGQVSHLDSMQDPETDLEINCRAQLRLLEACRRNNPDAKVVFASTRQIYGRPRYLPVDEKHPIQPTDVNGVNKRAGELYHQLYHDVYGIRTCSLRLTNTYGPRQYVRTDRQTFIGWFFRQIVEGDEIRIFGDGSQLRDFTYVDDCVDGFLRAGALDAANGEVFNVGGMRPVSLIELTRMLIAIAGTGSYTLIPFPEGRRAIDIGSFYADDQKIRRVLGWAPTIPLESGLATTIEYFRANREHYW
jgi:UDP-glucose 4-epimerase